MAKFIKWLFEYFIILVNMLFYVSYIKEERVYIPIKDWTEQKRVFLKKMNDKMALEPISKTPDENKTKNKLFLIPKNNGVRPIFRSKYVLIFISLLRLYKTITNLVILRYEIFIDTRL